MKRVAIALVFLAATASLRAQSHTAGDLRDACLFTRAEHSNESSKATFCVGYMNGWMAAAIESGNLMTGRQVSVREMEEIFLTFMDAHPEKAGGLPGHVLLQALEEVGIAREPKGKK